MKRTVIFLILLFTSNSLLFSQVEKDSLGGNIYPQFYDSFSAEESWEIHRNAYIKQLKSKGLTGKRNEQ